MNKKTICLLALVSFSLFGLTGCDKTSTISGSSSSDESISQEVNEYVVIFDLNYEGSGSSSVKVNKGSKVSMPTDPIRDGYVFTGWWTDKTSSVSFDFNCSVDANLTIYAGWIDAANASTATFYWNKTGTVDSIYKTLHFTKGDRVSKPEDPFLDGYSFSGWYEEANCTTEFSFLKKRSTDVSVYAYWVKSYTFEAEYTQLTGLNPDTDETCNTAGDKLGQGYSGNVTGKMMICANNNSGANASNGYYISNLYYNGAFIEYKITSDKAVSNVSLQLSLSAEFYDISINSEDFLVEVNGTDLSYNDIVFNDVVTDMNSEKKKPFQDYYINKTSLKEGENSIKLTVNNDSSPQVGAGSMDAKAPMIDCMYLITDSNLSWSPYTSNIG